MTKGAKDQKGKRPKGQRTKGAKDQRGKEPKELLENDILQVMVNRDCVILPP